ncbi:MAG TPA: hypothetical protein VGF25_01105 [Thermoleophilaceae bacterium]
MELALFLLLVLATGAVVTAPLRRSDFAPAGSSTAALEAARDAKLREIHDAELDHGTGKLSDEDYAVVDGTLRSEAAEILRELDRASS